MDEFIQIIDDALIQPIKLRSALVLQLPVAANWTEQARCERGVNAFEQFQEQ